MRSSSLSIEANSFVPVAPSGCPRAIAPPLTFTRAGSAPVSLIHAKTTGAKASLISTTSMSSILKPHLPSAYFVAGIGALSMKMGSAPRALR